MRRSAADGPDMRVVHALAMVLIAVAACGCAPATRRPDTAHGPCLPTAVPPRFFFWPVVGFREIRLATEDGGLTTASWVMYRKGRAAVAAMWVQGDLISVDPDPETDAPEWIDLSLVVPKDGKLVLRRHPEAPCQWDHWETEPFAVFDTLVGKATYAAPWLRWEQPLSNHWNVRGQAQILIRLRYNSRTTRSAGPIIATTKPVEVVVVVWAPARPSARRRPGVAISTTARPPRRFVAVSLEASADFSSGPNILPRVAFSIDKPSIGRKHLERSVRNERREFMLPCGPLSLIRRPTHRQGIDVGGLT